MNIQNICLLVNIQDNLNKMNSSYKKNNYSEVFYSIVREFQPNIAVELGILDGYSTCAIAKGIKDNKFGKLESYDLFEDYPYKHGIQEEVQKMINKRDLQDSVSLFKGDAFEVYDKYDNNSLLFLHVDISNDGDIISKILELWNSKIDVGGQIIFEGGTEERDNIEWMKKYNRSSIKQEIETNTILNTCYVYGTYLKFPGLTVCLKKNNDI